jgi:hypothetical protein
MQEDVEHRSIALSIRAAKLTARLLAKAMLAVLRKIRKGINSPHGKQSVKQLAKKDAGMTNIEITDGNIKSFERVARKYGIDFALKKEAGEPPRWLVFFKGRDADAITAAFGEYSKKTLPRVKRPSVRDAVRNPAKQEKSAERGRQPKQRERVKPMVRGGKSGPVL